MSAISASRVVADPTACTGRSRRLTAIFALFGSALLCAALALMLPQTAAASSLPGNLLTSPGTQLSGFDADASSWTVYGGTVAANTSQYREGTGSLRMTGPGTTVKIQKTISANMSGGGAVRLWVYLHTDPATTVSGLYIRFSEDTNKGPSYGFGRHFYYYLTGSSLRQGWNLLSIAESGFVGYPSNGVSPSWADTMQEVRIELLPKAGTTASMSVDDLRFGVVSQPVVLLSFKNGTAGQFANAFPVLSTAGFAGTAFIDSSDVGKTGQMTLSQLQSLYGAGWDVGNHSDSSAQLTTLSLSGAESALSDCTNYLLSNGMPRAAHQVAYVDGMYNDTVLQAMHDTGEQSGTYIAGLNAQQFQPLPMDNPYLIPSWDAGLMISGTVWQGGTVQPGGVNAVENKIAAAAAQGSPVEIVFHDVSAAGTTSSQYTVSANDLTAICDFIKQRGLPVVTISQLYALNNDPTMLVQNDHWAPTTTASTAADPQVLGGRIVTLNAVDPMSGVAATTYSLDGAPNATYQGPFPVSPGPHSLTFSSVDKAGNVESLRTMADFQPPVTTAGAAEGAWVSGKGSLKLTSTDALSGGSSVREIDYSLDGGQTWRSTPGASASVVATVEGPATIVFHAVDSAGNVEADQTLDVLVDNTAPTSTLKGVDALPHSSPVTLTLSAVDAALGNYAHGSDVAGISYSIDRATAVTTPGAGPLEFVIPEGDHSVTYWSTDTAGNAEAARTVWVRVSAPLPPNLTTDPGTQVSSFDDASGWTLLSVNGSGGSVTENTSQAHEGSGSLQLTTGDPTTTAGTVIAQMKFSQGIDMSSMLNGATIRFWAYVAPDQALTSPSNILKTFRLRLSPDADGSFTDQFKWETNRTAIHSGWNLITFSASDDMLVAQGNVSWNQPMLYARVEVTANPNQTTPASVSFDDLRYGVRATPAVIMSFDDGDPTVIGSAFPIMQAHGLVGTAYVVSSWVGNPNESSMTLADLKTLYAAGWDIGNHTVDHPSGTGLDTLDLASVEAELTGCRDFLVNNGMPRAALDVAYPGGYANDTVEQAMAATGMQTGRITSWRPMALPIDDGYQVPGSTTAVGTLTLQQIEHRIDQAVADGATIELIFHALGDPSLDPGYPAAPSYYQPIDEFTSICDYIAQQGIPTMTVSQFYAHSQNGPSSDTTPPITTTDYATGWHASPLTVDLTASDAGSGVDYTQYSLDGGHSWTNGNAVTIAASGTTAISYRSADQAGNLEQTKNVAVNVDAAAPVTAATVQPGGWTAGSVTVTLAADDTGGSGLAGTYYRIGAQSAQTYSGAITVSDATPIVYWSADNAGNIEIAKTLAPQIDTTSPVTTATMTPGTGGEAVVTLNASDPLSGVAEIDYSGDGGATWTSVAAAQAQVTLPLNGSMSLRYHAVDNVGNNEGDETYELDGQPPVTSITAGPTAWITAGGATFSWSGTDDWTPAAQLVYQYQLDGGAWSGWASATSATLTGLSEGRHTFVVEARDLSGHVDTSPPSSAFSVDTIAPAASATANPAGWTRSSVTVTFTASDAGSGLVTSSATCTVDGVAHAFTYGSPVSITAPGNHAVAFTIKDVAGNTATAKVNAQIDLSAPTATATASPSGWTNGNVSVNLAATDPLSGIDTGSATYAIDGAAGQPLTWGSPVVVTAVGSHTIAFTVKDLAGNSAAASTTARIDRTAPVTTVNYNSTAWQRANVTLRFTATDSGGSGVSSTQSSTNGGTTWTSGTSRTISTGGQTTVLYRSTDTAGNVETSHTVVVKLDKTAPTIVVTAPASGGTYLRGQVVPAAWTATDATSGINAALTTSQPVANGAAIPTSTFGTKSFSVTATDVAGNAVTRAVSYSVPFASAGVLAPISANGSSSFARGTTVPVAFVLTNSGGGAYSTARPHLLLSRRQADGSWGAEVAAVANPPVSGGNQFTYAGSGRYTFNLSTTALAAGVWRLHIDLGGGGALYAQLTLT